MWNRLKSFLNPFDARYEDLVRGNVALNILRDFTAGLIVSMVAIPLAMGMAMASGLRPEQGILAGAVACLLGALMGGSKYQIYGPTAVFIPVIAGIMATHNHSYLVLVSLVAAVILILLSFAGAGKLVQLFPHSIIVGFTIGIATTIALSQVGEVFGFHQPLPYQFFPKIRGIIDQIGHLKLWAVVIALGTLLLTKILLRVSIFIPAPLIALGIGAFLANGFLSGEELTLIKTKFGSIPAQSWVITVPTLSITAGEIIPILYSAITIVFIAAIESLLCSRMADRLAGNRGLPFNPDRELWGQGWVMAVVPLLNGFPTSGALARTATNIKLGALSPLAGIFKFALKLLIAFYLAHYLELVPMACIGGILLYVAYNMVKKEEVEEVFAQGRGHTALMIFTAVTVAVVGFLPGVLAALAIFGVWQMLNRKKAEAIQAPKTAAIRAEIASAGARVRAVLAKGPAAVQNTQAGNLTPSSRIWSSHIRQSPVIPATAYVHPQATVIGKVVLGNYVHIAAGSSIRADEGSPFYIGANSNIQDGVVIHALKDRHVVVGSEPWAVYVGKEVSMAHQALIHGPCFIGDETFIGFKAVIHDSVVSEHCYVGIGATVVGVQIPSGRFVPHGSVVDTQEKADQLPLATESHAEFNEDVVEVNRGLAVAYQGQHKKPSRVVAHPVAAASAGWGPKLDSGRGHRLEYGRF